MEREEVIIQPFASNLYLISGIPNQRNGMILMTVVLMSLKLHKMQSQKALICFITERENEILKKVRQSKIH